MKRQGNLLEKIADLSNLELAYYKAKKGKKDSSAIRSYGEQLYQNLARLRTQLLSGEVEIGNYHFFIVYDPKKRQICAAPFEQRVLHHALMIICHPYFEKKQVSESYASRIGKGTYAALEKAQVNTRKYTWYLKLDVRKYFDSIHHGVLRSQLCRMFKDPILLRIFDEIIDSYSVENERGIPIGNLTSQYFANHYLSVADHYVKEVLQVPACVRYMDDVVLWHDNKEKLLKIGQRYQEYVQNELKLTLKPFCMNQSIQGLPFLGYLVFPGTTRLAKRSRKRYIRKITYYDSLVKNGQWSQADFQRHVLPLTAFTLHADAKGFRQKIHTDKQIE